MLFTLTHAIWIVFCICEIVVALWLIKKYDVKLDKIISIGCWFCLIRTLLRVLDLTKMVPSADGTMFFSYFSDMEFPFHLCGMQMFGLLICQVTESEKIRKYVLAYMYPTCIIGAVATFMTPSILSVSPVPMREIFTAIKPYEFFTYHSMLFVLGWTFFKQVDLKPRDYVSTVYILIALLLGSVMLNSAMAGRVYVNNELISIDHITDYCFTTSVVNMTSLNPKWDWIKRFLGEMVGLIGLITVLYIPVFRKARRENNK